MAVAEDAPKSDPLGWPASLGSARYLTGERRAALVQLRDRSAHEDPSWGMVGIDDDPEDVGETVDIHDTVYGSRR